MNLIVQTRLSSNYFGEIYEIDLHNFNHFFKILGQQKFATEQKYEVLKDSINLIVVRKINKPNIALD